ncbi:MAG TPA: response regulator [Vicinamibacterales bacterium]|nr:response regulator [Vicinamibacterales bacterium]
MIPRVLVVEDRPHQLRDMVRYLETIDEAKKARRGIDRFEVVQAMWADDADDLLDIASETAFPFDIMLVDLNLPRNKTDRHEQPEFGLELLERAQKARAAKEMIVISAFKAHDWNAKAIRAGAVDFIGKPFQPETLQAQVLKSLDRILVRESERALANRLRLLVPHVERGLAYRLASCFSQLVQATAGADEDLRAELSQRFSLESDDSLMETLRRLQKAAGEAREEWAKLHDRLVGEQREPENLSIMGLLTDAVKGLESCLTVKRARVAFVEPVEKVEVLSFNGEVLIVLNELIVGGLSEVSDEDGEAIECTLSVRAVEDQVEVTLTDRFRPIEATAARQINSGYAVPADAAFGRVWGLSIIQHVALRGGGRLIIEPDVNGNVVRYRIPRGV